MHVSGRQIHQDSCCPSKKCSLFSKKKYLLKDLQIPCQTAALSEVEIRDFAPRFVHYDPWAAWAHQELELGCVRPAAFPIVEVFKLCTPSSRVCPEVFQRGALPVQSVEVVLLAAAGLASGLCLLVSQRIFVDGPGGIQRLGQSSG